MKLGNANVNKIRLGSTQMKRVYLGSNIVWQNAPTAIAATGVGTTSFTAEWEAYSGATYYLLDVSESSDFSTFIYQNQLVEAPNTSYVVIGLNSNTTYYYRVRASDDDVDAALFFERVDAATGVPNTLSNTEKSAINQLVVDMKDNGIWTKMKAIYPMVGGGNPTLSVAQAACSQNLKSSNFTGTFTATGWTFASTGAKPNGANAYMNSGLNANAQLNINSSHISYYARNLNTSSGFNVFMGIGSVTCYMQGSNNNVINTQLAGTGATLQDTPVGFLMGNKQNSTTQQTYKNNLSSTNNTGSTTSFSTTSQNIFIGNYDTGGIFGTNSECAFSSIGDGFSNVEALALYNIVQNFNTTLSRQV